MDEGLALASPAGRPESRAGIHLRVSAEWQDWQECCQMRRPRFDLFEFRRSSPLFMLLALALVVAAFDAAFLGALFPYGGLTRGALLLAPVVPLFALGRGTRIDGATRRVARWWGFVPRPLLTADSDFGDYRAVEVTRKFSFARGRGGGRWVRHPVHLVPRNGRSRMLFRCTWHADALELGRELASQMGVPFRDRAAETPHPG